MSPRSATSSSLAEKLLVELARLYVGPDAGILDLSARVFLFLVIKVTYLISARRLVHFFPTIWNRPRKNVKKCPAILGSKKPPLHEILKENQRVYSIDVLNTLL